jgi:hypothetical protein
MKKWLFASLVVFGLVLNGRPDTQLPVNEFADQYKKAKTEQEKLQLCIKAIDTGLIQRGIPVSRLDKIFGTNFSKDVPKKGEPLEWGVVHFGKELKSSSDLRASGWEGWYLAVQFDDFGSVQNYYLSNLHK